MSQLDALQTPPRPAPRVSYDEFLAGDWGTAHVEWVDGEVVMMAAVTGEHDEVLAFLSTVVRWFVRRKGLGVVRGDPFQMKAGPDLPGRAPDLLFLRESDRARLHKTWLEGPADLAVEVISPGSLGTDRGTKFAEYEQGGVAEYWLIDPLRKQADFYGRGTDGYFRPLPASGDVFRSVVLDGLWLRLGWLWDRPDVTDVFVDWGLLKIS